MDIGKPTVSTWRWRRGSVCRGVLYALTAALLLVVVGYVAWRESERSRFARLDALIHRSYEEQSSFKFSSEMVVWLNVSEPITSIEHDEGTYAADGKFGFIVHKTTKTRVETLHDKREKTMTAERLMGGSDDWIRYHVIEPHTLSDDAILGKWQDTADVMDGVLEDLTYDEGQKAVSQVAESLEFGNPLADPGMVFALLKPELARWVTPSYEKKNLRCCNVLLNPRMLVDDFIATFDFTGPGIGLSSLGYSQVSRAHLHTEYCWTSDNLVASMVTEAKKSGTDGFNFRKEVHVFQYNDEVQMPVPSHDNCQLQGEQHLHGCTWLT